MPSRFLSGILAVRLFMLAAAVGNSAIVWFWHVSDQLQGDELLTAMQISWASTFAGGIALFAITLLRDKTRGRRRDWVVAVAAADVQVQTWVRFVGTVFDDLGLMAFWDFSALKTSAKLRVRKLGGSRIASLALLAVLITLLFSWIIVTLIALAPLQLPQVDSLVLATITTASNAAFIALALASFGPQLAAGLEPELQEA